MVGQAADGQAAVRLAMDLCRDGRGEMLWWTLPIRGMLWSPEAAVVLLVLYIPAVGPALALAEPEWIPLEAVYLIWLPVFGLSWHPDLGPAVEAYISAWVSPSFLEELRIARILAGG